MVGGRRNTKNLRERVVLKVPIVLLAAIFIFYGAWIALAATNVSSVPQLLTNPTDISPANGDGFFDTTTVSYSLVNQGYSNIRIYNNSSATQPLRSLLSSSFQSAGGQAVVWDGKDDGASFLPDKTDYSIKYDGVSFTSSSVPGTGANLGQIAVDNSSNPPTIYVAREGNNGLWRSTDGGTNWTQITYGGNNNVRGIALLRIGATAPNGYFNVGGSLFGAAMPQTNTTVLAVADSSTQGNPPRYRLFLSHDAGTTWINRSLQKKNGSQTPPPGQLAIDPLGQIYICSNGAPPNGVYKYNFDPDSSAWGVSGLLQDFTNAKSIAIKDSATIFVADVDANKILKSIDGGNSFEVIVGSGSGDGQVSGPQGISFDNGTDGRGRLWVADTGNNRVQQLYSDGQFIQKIGFAQAGYNLTAPIGVGVDGQDNLFVSDSGGNRITKYVRDNVNGPNIGIDNSPPISASIYSVSSAAGTGIYHKGNIALTADAEDTGVGVGWVEFYDGLGLLGIDADPAGGWTYNWATNPLLDGEHFVNVKVYDKAYNVRQSVDRIVVVDNTNPTVLITTPTSAGFVRGSVQVTGTASDNNFKQYTVEYGSGEVPGSWSSLGTFIAPVSNGNLVVWNTGDLGLTGGVYTLRLTAVDDALNQVSNSVTVTLDNDPPTATTGIAVPEIFSPKADGSRVTTVALSSSDNYGLDGTTPWKLEFKNTAGMAVRTYTGTGSPASQAWNGLYDDNVTVVQSGNYTYVYTVTDKAGNSFTTAPKTITVDFTGPNVSIGNANPSTFSPGITTTQIGPMMASDTSGVAGWKVEFNLFGNPAVLRTFSGVGDPSGNSIIWDGKTDGGVVVADGVYEYVFKAYDTGDNETASAPKIVTVDTEAPIVSDDSVDPVHFSPNNDGVNEKVRINASISDLSSVTWELVILNEFNAPVISVSNMPGNFVNYEWDGKIGGNAQPNGPYTYNVRARDIGGNESGWSTGTFYLDTVKPTANAGLASNNPFSPNADGIKDNTMINITGSDFSPIVSWNLQIEDQTATPVRNFSGVNATNTLSETVIWDGKDNGGVTVPDGTYTYILIAQDAAGNFFVAPQRTVVVDNTKPVINSIVASPLYFAPAASGNGYKTSAFNANITDNLSSVSWQIDVKSGVSTVKTFTGSGPMNTNIAQIWDGKNGSEVVQPDGLYDIEVNSVDAAGNTAILQSSVVNVDSTRPAAEITNPSPDSKLFGIINVEGSASDTNIDFYVLDLGLGASPLAWDPVGGGTENVTDALLYEWDTRSIGEDDNYTLRLIARDKANNSTTYYVIISIENKLLISSITGPEEGDIVNGIEPVVGIATNTNQSFFKSYRVEAQLQGSAVLSWQTIGTGSLPLSNATLSDWITTKFKDGDYILRVLAFDKAGNVIQSRKNVKVDNTPPAFGIISPANKLIVSGAEAEKIVITDVIDNIAGMHETNPVELTINDEPVEAVYDAVAKTVTYEPVGGFEDGIYNASLILRDEKGNVSKPVLWTFTVDNLLPEAVITTPADSSIIGGLQPIVGTASDKHLALWKLEYKLSSASSWTAITPLSGYLASSKVSVNNSTISVWKTPTIAGAYDLRLTATDISGKQWTAVKSIIVDPAIAQEYEAKAEITSPDGSGFVRGSTVIRGNASLVSDFQNYTVYARKIAPVTEAAATAVFNSTAPVKGTPDGSLAVWNTAGKNGTYELQVKVFSTTQAEPVLTSPVTTVQVDNTAPPVPTKVVNLPVNGGFTNLARPQIVASGVRDTGFAPEKPWISGITDATIEMRLDGQLVNATFDVIQSRVTYTPVADLADGKHIVTLRVKDIAGNTMLKLIKWSFNVDKGGLTAQITRPYEGEVIKGTFAIRGIAYSKNIKTYKIEAYMVNDPKSNTTPLWKPLATVKKGVKKQATLFKWKTKISALYKIRLVVEDKAGNRVTTAPTSVRVDNNAPSIDIPFPAPKAISRTPEGWDGVGVQVAVNDALDKFFRPGSGINFTRTSLKLNDARVPTVYESENNTVNYKPEGGLGDGVYNASLTVYDTIGNSAVKNWTFTVDNTAPTASIVSPASTSIISLPATQINGMAFDKNIKYYQLESKLSFEDMWKTVAKVKFNVGDPTIPANGTLGVLPLPTLDEIYDMRLTVVDKAGNISIYPNPESPHQLRVQRTATYDWGSDDVALTHPLNGTAFNGKATPNLLITGSAKDADFHRYVVTVKQTAPVAGSTTTILTSYSRVDRGTLATWPIGSKNGEFEIGVEVYKTSGVLAAPKLTTNVVVDSEAAVVKPLGFTPPANSFTSNPTQAISVTYVDKVGMNSNKFKVYIDGYLMELTPGNSSYNAVEKKFIYTPDVAMSDGLHTISVYAEDMGGFPVTTLKGWTFTVDSNTDIAPTPPEASISSPAENGYASGIISITGTAFDPSIASYKLEFTNDVVSPEPAWTLIGTVAGKSVLDASLFKWDASKLTDGQYKIRLSLLDKAGNSLTAIRQFNLDNTLAVAQITSPTLTTNIIKGTTEIKGVANDTNFKKYRVEYLRSGTTNWNLIEEKLVAVPVDDVLTNWDTTLVPDGTYTIKLIVTDQANVSSFVTLAVKVDNAAPNVQITTPSNNAWVRGTFTAYGSQSDLNLLSRIVEAWPVDIGGNPTGPVITIASGTSSIQPINPIASWNTPTVVDGRYKIKATALDKAGNSSSAEIIVNIDNLKPVATVSNPIANDFIKGIKTVVGTVFDTNIASYKVESKLGTAAPVLIGTATVNKAEETLVSWDTSVLIDGNYTLILTALDTAGNTTVTQVQVKVDNTLPAVEITAPLAGAILSGMIDVKGTVNDTNIFDWKVEYENAANPGVWVQVGTTGLTNKTGSPAPTLVQWDTDPLANGTYKLRLVANDKAGNQSIAQVINLTK